MENRQDRPSEAVLEIPIPEACPVCGVAWAEGVCARCGLTREDIVGLLRRGCDAYVAARTAARQGDFAGARRLLHEVRRSGIPALSEHPAVLRLAELCADPFLVPDDDMPAKGDSVIPAATATPAGESGGLPAWLTPFAVGGSLFGLAAFVMAFFALLLSVVALVLALIALLRS
ncbi:MAG: hypothetical protein SFU56_14055 [Capsulimonadales bacterium]|nr:hypothetical protein [Capsulimonadales bacterium]